jgi:hypothetical protein
MTDIIWTGKLRKDYTAQVGGYTLRAEIIDKGCWWWACYLNGQTIDHACIGQKYAKNGNAARHSAINAMNEHKSKQ